MIIRTRTPRVWDDYDLAAHSRLRIDFEHIVELLQGFVESFDPSETDSGKAEFESRIKSIREIIAELASDSSRLSALLLQVVEEIEQDKARFIGQDVSVMLNRMRYAVLDAEIRKYAEKWYLDFEDVRYEAMSFRLTN